MMLILFKIDLGFSLGPEFVEMGEVNVAYRYLTKSQFQVLCQSFEQIEQCLNAFASSYRKSDLKAF